MALLLLLHIVREINPIKSNPTVKVETKASHFDQYNVKVGMQSFLNWTLDLIKPVICQNMYKSNLPSPEINAETLAICCESLQQVIPVW